MRKRKSQIGRLTSRAKIMRYKRSIEDEAQRESRLLQARLRIRAKRISSVIKESNSVDLVTDISDEVPSRNTVATNIEEVNVPEFKSGHICEGDMSNDAGSVNKSECNCCLEAEVKMEEPLDCHVEIGS